MNFAPLTGCAVLPPLEAPARNKPKGKAGRRAGRFAILNRFIDVALRDLTRAETATWFVLYRDTKHDGTAQTGQADIARRAGLSKRAVQTALQMLKAKGLVEVFRRGRLNSGASIYRVHAVAR